MFRHAPVIIAFVAILSNACAYKSPTVPSTIPPAPSPTTPASLSIGFTAGVGSQAGVATIIAMVQNGQGSRLANIAVGFVTDTGVLADAHATTDTNGEARTQLTAASTAKITATAGSLTTTQLVVAEPPSVSLVPPPPPIPPPTPPPPAPTPAPSPSYVVTVAASPSALALGAGATLTATVTAQNGALAPTSFAWDCTGTGAPITMTAINTTTCTYNTAGPITSKVVVTGGVATGSGSTTVTVAAAAPLSVQITATTLTPTINTPDSFTATVTSSGPIPASMQWDWDWNGDGAYEQTFAAASSPNSQTHTFGATGVQTIKVRVTDAVTGRQAIGTVQITVQP